LCCVESQVRQTAEVEEYSLLNVAKSKQNMPAYGASRDESRTIHIHTCLREAPFCAAIRTLSFGVGNIYCEYSAQFPSGGISI
jgi:hypothetical protein